MGRFGGGGRGGSFGRAGSRSTYHHDSHDPQGFQQRAAAVGGPSSSSWQGTVYHYDRCSLIAERYYVCKLNHGDSHKRCQEYLDEIRRGKCPDHLGEKWEFPKERQMSRCRGFKALYDDCRLEKGISHESCQYYLNTMPKEKCPDSLFVEKPGYLKRRQKFKCEDLERTLRSCNSPSVHETLKKQLIAFGCEFPKKLQMYRCKTFKATYDDCRIKEGDSHESCQKWVEMMTKEKCPDSLFVERPGHLQKHQKIKCQDLEYMHHRVISDSSPKFLEKKMAKFKCPGR